MTRIEDRAGEPAAAEQSAPEDLEVQAYSLSTPASPAAGPAAGPGGCAGGTGGRVSHRR